MVSSGKQSMSRQFMQSISYLRTALLHPMVMAPCSIRTSIHNKGFMHQCTNAKNKTIMHLVKTLNNYTPFRHSTWPTQAPLPIPLSRHLMEIPIYSPNQNLVDVPSRQSSSIIDSVPCCMSLPPRHFVEQSWPVSAVDHLIPSRDMWRMLRAFSNVDSLDSFSHRMAEHKSSTFLVSQHILD